MSAPTCPACGSAASLTDEAEIYPRRPDLADKPIWACAVCPDSYVGCHPGTQNPLGVPAGPELRAARQLLHNRMIDPLWKTADRCGAYEPEDEEARKVIRRAARRRVYEFMAERMGLTSDEAHTAMFDLERCRAAWRALQGVTYPQIRAWAQKRPKAEPKPRKRKAA